MFVSVKEKEDAHGDPEIQPMKEDDITFGEYRWESTDLTLDLWPLRRLTPPHQTHRSEKENRWEPLHDVTFIFSSDGSDPVWSAVGGLIRILDQNISELNDPAAYFLYQSIVLLIFFLDPE